MDQNSLAKRASLLHLSSLALADGMRSGSFKSLYRGQGIEFSGVREYLRGDDVRAIDWNVTARMGKPFVQMFEEERELSVFILVDASRSMCTGSGKKSRLSVALECASLLSLAAEHNSSPVGAVVFDVGVKFSCAPKVGKNQTLMLLSRFEDFEEQEDEAFIPVGSALDAALQGAAKLLKKRSLVMIFSDFRTAGWITPFARLCQKHDVVAVRITDPSDTRLPEVGTIPFVDSETGQRTMLPTSVPAFSRAWSESNQRHVEQWQKDCLRHGGIPFLLSTEQDASAELTHFFSARELR